eukprot:TRINITY_DN4333_c0_g1_i4.p1 TRINITY_DN4333_c0_g1~~TRINITY_DN4333_c0_g1_i4.p1  ORF type:complete len:260 (-),score=34.93 TRINITY_DN4333_c0_g1_i4:338-1117(-)
MYDETGFKSEEEMMAEGPPGWQGQGGQAPPFHEHPGMFHPGMMGGRHGFHGAPMENPWDVLSSRYGGTHEALDEFMNMDFAGASHKFEPQQQGKSSQQQQGGFEPRRPQPDPEPHRFGRTGQHDHMHPPQSFEEHYERHYGHARPGGEHEPHPHRTPNPIPIPASLRQPKRPSQGPSHQHRARREQHQNGFGREHPRERMPHAFPMGEFDGPQPHSPHSPHGPPGMFGMCAPELHMPQPEMSMGGPHSHHGMGRHSWRY